MAKADRFEDLIIWQKLVNSRKECMTLRSQVTSVMIAVSFSRFVLQQGALWITLPKVLNEMATRNLSNFYM